MMNYRVSQNGQPLPGKFFNTAQDAWEWIDKQRTLYEVQGIPVPRFSVAYFGTLVNRKSLCLGR